MSILGIVSEYNPFHNGHEYHISCSKAMLEPDTPVICVMSGDFVQRGEAAMYSKFARAEAACRCGADLVIELPLPWALSSAEGFAYGAVGLLDALGVTHLSFGSEAGETEPLEKIAECLIDTSFMDEVMQLMSKNPNLPFAAARQNAAEARLGEMAQLLSQPNNILAVEYIKALYKLGSSIKPVTVQRFGNAHDGSGEEGPRSASELRKMLNNGKDISEHIPAAALAVYAAETERGRVQSDRSRMETAVLSRLRMLDADYFDSLPDAADGVGKRLYKAVREEATLDGIYAAAKSKRYALSRIRRMCCCACLGIKAGMNEGVPPYARVLAANARGRALLREIDGKSRVPVITKPATVRSMTEDLMNLFAAGANAHDFYVLGYRAPAEKKGGMDWKTSPKIV